MKNLVLTWIDYTLFGFMFGMSLAVGVYYGCFGKKQKTTNDYLLGGKKMNVFPIAMSLVASTLSGVSLLGYPAEIYLQGSTYALISFTPILMGVLLSYIFLPIFWKLQLTTVFEYLEIRFHKSERMLASFLFTLINFLYLPMVIYAPSLAFNQMTGLNLYVVAVVTSSICIFYTTVGGLRAVVWADTLQLCITLCTLGFVLVMGIEAEGGLGGVWEKATLGDRNEFFDFDPDPTVRNTFWTVVIGTTFLWVAAVAVSPATTQRLFAVGSLADGKLVVLIFVTLTMVTKFICCFSGLIAYARYYSCDPFTSGTIKKVDQIVPYYVLDVAESIPGLSGLFVAGLFSTALSALSTYLNSISGIIYVDYLYRFLPPDTAQVHAGTFMKVITAVLGLFCVGMVFLVERLGTLLQLFSTINAVTLGPLLGMFILGIFFPFANRKGAFFGTLSGLIFTVFIVIKFQINVWNGSIKTPYKPLNTFGCNDTYINVNQKLKAVQEDDESSSEVFWLFRISFNYYVALGVLTTVAFGVIISLITGTDKPVNRDCVWPPLHRFISKPVLNAIEDADANELQLLSKENESIINDRKM